MVPFSEHFEQVSLPKQDIGTKQQWWPHCDKAPFQTQRFPLEGTKQPSLSNRKDPTDQKTDEKITPPPPLYKLRQSPKLIQSLRLM